MPDFDLDAPNILTAEQKLFNVKKKINAMKRHLDDLLHENDMTIAMSHDLHMMKVAISEIEKEIDRTV